MKKAFAHIDAIFKPRSIAVIGATMRKGSLGRTIMKNLVDYEFTGRVFPVNPNRETVHSMKCFPAVGDVPDQVDLGIIMVPRDYVLPAVIECGEKGVRSVVVLTAGFREVGEKGCEREEEVLHAVRKYGMRMVGPNCMGVINTHPDIRMDATFSPEFPTSGNIGVLSQSGALGVAIISAFRRFNLGLSQFISVGNKADVSGNDVLEYWEDDPDVEVVLLYLESFGDPRVFTRVAQRVSKKKPIIAVKAGRTRAGAKAASSHTGAIAGTDIAAAALLEKCGVIRVSTMEEMFELAVAFSRKKYPRGRHVAIVTNGGGPAIMAADALNGVGLEVPTLSRRTQDKIRRHLADEAAVYNPIDMIASGGPREYEKVLDIVTADSAVDAVLAISVTPPTLVNPGDVMVKIAQAARKTEKPVLAVVMGKNVVHTKEMLQVFSDLAAYNFPESPAKALAEMLRYRDWQEKPDGVIKKFRVRKERVKKILEREQQKKAHYLPDIQVYDVLTAYGFPVIESHPARTPGEAADVADSIGYPVTVKVTVPGLVHKSDIGGVAVDIRTREEVIDTFYTLQKRAESYREGTFSGVLIQNMVKSGTEVIFGMTSMESYGPLLMFGLGGIFVEIIKDVQFRPAPLTDLEAEEMIKSIKGYPLLAGVRGEKSVDISLLTECLQRLSQLVTDFDCIHAVDINPFIVSDTRDGSYIVDARILVGKP